MVSHKCTIYCEVCKYDAAAAILLGQLNVARSTLARLYGRIGSLADYGSPCHPYSATCADIVSISKCPCLQKFRHSIQYMNARTYFESNIPIFLGADWVITSVWLNWFTLRRKCTVTNCMSFDLAFSFQKESAFIWIEYSWVTNLNQNIIKQVIRYS